MDWEKKEGILYVRTFGGFSLEWNRAVIESAGKSGRTQFARIMQILLHYRDRGVSRGSLEELLFGGRNIADVHHTMQSVIYNAKKRLKLAGLPEDNYIVQKKGIFYWTGQIPVEEDASRFERLCQKAEQEQEESARLELYLEACALFAGDFLPGQPKEAWAALEAERYRAMFRSCVTETARLLRERGEYSRLEYLSRHIEQAAPSEEWESLRMEALMAQGKSKEAERLYEDTAQRCFGERGAGSSGQLLKKLSELGAGIKYASETLDVIQGKLAEEEGGAGGYLCSYPVFRGIYSMMRRITGQGGQRVYLMSCTVVDGSGVPMREGKQLEELAQRLETVVCRSVSREDAVCRYGRGQYLILLFDRTREECKGLQKRIDKQFLVGRQRTGVRYYIRDVV